MKKFFENTIVRISFWLLVILIILLSIIFDDGGKFSFLGLKIYGVIGTTIVLILDLYTTIRRKK